jgi:branched-chain amino acid transport system substrate-binding protein
MLWSRKQATSGFIGTVAVVYALSLSATSFAKDIRIAHVYDKTGFMEEFSKQTSAGFKLGLEYATNGTMEVNGNKLVVFEKDTQSKPDLGKSLLASAYADDKADIAIGPTSSATAVAMLPVAEEYKKLLIVEPAAADSITGEKWNRYIFRTGRSSSQDAIASALVIDHPGASVAVLAQDYAFGRDGVKALKAALKKATIVHEEYVPINNVDFTAAGQRIIDALKNKPGKKIIYVFAWAGQGNPFKVANLNPQRYGIEIAAGGHSFQGLVNYKPIPGMEGAIYYYHSLPKNKINDWLVARFKKDYGTPPDLYVPGGMSAAIALVEALKKTGGDPDTEKLIKAMEGMSFDTPKGKMTFRKEDHQAMQAMYHFKIKADPAVAWGIPELVREIKAEDMAVPITVKK